MQKLKPVQTDLFQLMRLCDATDGISLSVMLKGLKLDIFWLSLRKNTQLPDRLPNIFLY